MIDETINWKEMSDAERNACVSEKVMGWKPRVMSDGVTRFRIGDSGAWYDPFTFTSAPIAYAQVLNKIRSLGWDTRVDASRRDGEEDWSFEARFDIDQGNGCLTEFGWSTWEGDAICIAALRAIGYLVVGHVTTS